jgi:hypothetical protein
MKSIDQLRDFFNTDLKSDILSVEGKRKGIVFKVIAVVLFMTALLVLIVYTMLKAEMSIGWIVMVVLVLPVLTGALYFDLVSNRDFYTDFKTRVIERILKFIDPSFTYISHKYIQPKQLVESKLFSHIPKKYKGDDYVQGVIGKNTKLEFSEVVARHKNVVPTGSTGKSQSNSNSDWQLTFKGLFFVANVDRNFKGQTFVLPAGEGVESLMITQGHTPVPIEVGDQNFRNFFTVFTTDADEARRLISDVLQARLIEFRSHRTNPVRFSFVGSHINVAIWHEKDLFEPKIFSTLLNFGIIEEYYDDLYQAISVMEQIETSQSTMA